MIIEGEECSNFLNKVPNTDFTSKFQSKPITKTFMYLKNI